MKRVAPRLSTPGPGLPQTSDARLPADLLNDQVRRLEIFALVSGGLWAMGLLMDAVIFPLSIGAESPNTAALVIEGGAVLVAAAIYAWVRFSGGTAEAKSDIGMPNVVDSLGQKTPWTEPKADRRFSDAEYADSVVTPP